MTLDLAEVAERESFLPAPADPRRRIEACRLADGSAVVIDDGAVTLVPEGYVAARCWARAKVIVRGCAQGGDAVDQRLW